MIEYTQGNLLDADAEALVNTVNTVGVMGKGIALMFKEAFPENYKAYAIACEAEEIVVGEVFSTYRTDMYGPKWIVNFPTKKHWRHPSQIGWIEAGLEDLRSFIVENNVRSIAIPPLGAGNGGLNWADVKPLVDRILGDLTDTRIIVFEPTSKYQNVAKTKGVEKLTPARALVAEAVRRYSVLGLDCSLLEVQKLAWFLNRSVGTSVPKNPLSLNFQANRYGPYSDRLRHLLDGLDGSYLRCDKRLGDAGPADLIHFDEDKRTRLLAYLTTPEAVELVPALELTSQIIDGFESPLGMELLATVDWLLHVDGVSPSVEGIRRGISTWPAGTAASERKQRIFDDRLIELALERLEPAQAALAH
ncbi:MAG: macro domain-containing protein [Brevundimonas sp.]